MIQDLFKESATRADIKRLEPHAICLHDACFSRRTEQTLYGHFLKTRADCDMSFTICNTAFSAKDIKTSDVNIIMNCGTGTGTGTHGHGHGMGRLVDRHNNRRTRYYSGEYGSVVSVFAKVRDYQDTHAKQ